MVQRSHGPCKLVLHLEALPGLRLRVWGMAGGGYCSDFLGGVGCSANPNEGNRVGKLITLTLIRCAFPFGE